MINEEEKKLRERLKKELAKGMIIPAGYGCILAVCDLPEYIQSKKVGGFVASMPISLYVKGAGVGQYEENIEKFMSIEEATVLRDSLNLALAMIEKVDATFN